MGDLTHIAYTHERHFAILITSFYELGFSNMGE